MRRILIACALLIGCGSEEQEATTEVVDETGGEEREIARPPVEEVTAYDIHEWGLIDVDLSAQRVELAAGPGHVTPVAQLQPIAQPQPHPQPQPIAQPQPIPIPQPQPNPVRPPIAAPRKPVLYFHLRDANPSFTFDLTVNLAGIRLVEHFPQGNASANSVRWEDVGLRAEHCSGGPYPTASDPRCQNLADGYCEVAELETYVTNDSGCLTVGGQEQSLLFYRGDGTAPPLPVTIERTPEGTVRITNASMTSVGSVLRFRRAAPGGPIHVVMDNMPGPGGNVVIPMPSAPANGAHRDAIRRQLTALGMTPSESEAFERAWFGELFDGAAPTPHAFTDAVLFFLPEGGADAYARLEASPPPASVRRAMAIRAGWP